MQPYSQEVMDTVLSLIPHENHRKLATMLMNGTSIEEIKTHGFDDIQIEQYNSLIASVVSGETPLKETPKAEEPAPEQPQAEPTPEVTQPEPQPEETQPTTTEPVIDNTDPVVETTDAVVPDTTTDTPAELPTEESTVPNAGEIPA